MKRLIPFAVVGFAVMLLGLAVGSGLLAVGGAACLAVGVVWFVTTSTGSGLGKERAGRG